MKLILLLFTNARGDFSVTKKSPFAYLGAYN